MMKKSKLKTSNSSKEWRAFEKLVARIEKTLVPRGALVKSPDRVLDKITNRMREIDASIRYQIGTTPILITIECRKRRRVSDDTWIEQLAKKREKLGAATTVAVSSTSFSESAIKTARISNIELRRIEEIGADEILGWLKISVYQHFLVKSILQNFEIQVYGGGDAEKEGQAIPLIPEAAQSLESDIFNSPLFTLKSGPSITLNWLYQYFKINYPTFHNDIPFDGTKVRKRIRMDFPAGLIHVSTIKGLRAISALLLELDVYFEKFEPSINNVKAFVYSDQEQALVRGAEYSMDLLGNSIVLSLQKDLHSPKLHFTISEINEKKDQAPIYLIVGKQI